MVELEIEEYQSQGGPDGAGGTGTHHGRSGRTVTERSRTASVTVTGSTEGSEKASVANTGQVKSSESASFAVTGQAESSRMASVVVSG